MRNENLIAVIDSTFTKTIQIVDSTQTAVDLTTKVIEFAISIDEWNTYIDIVSSNETLYDYNNGIYSYIYYNTPSIRSIDIIDAVNGKISLKFTPLYANYKPGYYFYTIRSYDNVTREYETHYIGKIQMVGDIFYQANT